MEEEGERALSYKEPTRKSRYTQVAAWRPSSQGGRFPSWRYRAQHSAELFHRSSLDDGRPEAAVVAGGVRAVVSRGGGARAQLRGPRPLVPQSGGTCCAAEKCVLQSLAIQPVLGEPKRPDHIDSQSVITP